MAQWIGKQTLSRLFGSNDLKLEAGNWQIDNVAVSASADELNITDGMTATAAELNILNGQASLQSTITVAIEAGNAIGVNVQLKDANATNVTSSRALVCWLSSTNAAPYTVIGTAPDGGVAAGATGKVIAAITAGKVFYCATDAAGSLDLTLTESGNTAIQYLCVQMPTGRIKASAAIDFA